MKSYKDVISCSGGCLLITLYVQNHYWYYFTVPQHMKDIFEMKKPLLAAPLEHFCAKLLSDCKEFDLETLCVYF